MFDFLKRPDINDGFEEYKNTEGAFLLDVRTPEEYAQGHIPGSMNIPLQTIESVDEVVPDLSANLFVYCRSGARSAQAAAMLKQMGYTNVKNFGGIAAYRGKVER